jgi:hypothetical protein
MNQLNNRGFYHVGVRGPFMAALHPPMKKACAWGAGFVVSDEARCSAEVQASFDALYAFKQLVHGQLLMRAVFEKMNHIAPHVDDRILNAADALADVSGVSLHVGDLAA